MTGSELISFQLTSQRLSTYFFPKYANVLTNGMFLNIDSYLGIHIDEHLTWEHHINYCKKKVFQWVYEIIMSKHILGQKHLTI